MMLTITILLQGCLKEIKYQKQLCSLHLRTQHQCGGGQQHRTTKRRLKWSTRARLQRYWEFDSTPEHTGNKQCVQTGACLF